MNTLRYTVIKNNSQYNSYCEKLESLIMKNPGKNSDEIDLLGLLIEEYNNRIMEKHNSKLDPVELLLDIKNEHKLTQIELAKKVGVSPQLITDIMKYRREISKKLAFKLGEEFKLNFSIFLKPYNLKKVG